MKKVLLVSAFAVLALASCKKDYTCKCKSSMDGVVTEISTKTIHDTKEKAQASCSKSSISSANGGTLTTVCNIE